MITFKNVSNLCNVIFTDIILKNKLVKGTRKKKGCPFLKENRSVTVLASPMFT